MSRTLPRFLSLSLLCLLPLLAAAAPTANFTASVVSGCSPIVVQFTDASTGSPTSWSWDLGNGTTSNVQNPSTTYITPGTYTVTLTATNASGSNTKAATGYITVIAPPVVGFTGSDTAGGCAPKTVVFTSTITPGVPGVVTYLWDFGDGTTATAANPTKVYNTLGNFTVTLVATNASGCSASLSKAAYIKTSSKPAGAFTVSGAGATCSLPVAVSFSNSTTGAVSYAWDFGNSTTSTATSPTAMYAAAGTYTVKLVSTGAGGCKDTVQQTVIITSTPLTAAFTAPATGCTNAGVGFTNTSSPTPGSVLWDFGDGTTSTAYSPAKTYTAQGTYTVKLKIASGTCVDSTTRTITIAASPVATFTASPASACAVPAAITLTNTSTGTAPLSYTWNFGDGTTSTATTPSKTYGSFGTYNITLTATASNGCSATSGVQTISLAAPTLSVAKSLPNGSCIPALVNFTTAMSPAPGGTTYSWTFGDGGTGTGAAPGYTYAAAGSYTVTVTATTPAGCTATATTTVAVGAKPSAGFTGNPLAACVGTNITFTNTSTGATSYLWNWGTSGSATTTSPTISYANPGTYTVTLIATNNGCSDTMIKPAYVTITGPAAFFTDAFSCSSKLTHTFTNGSTGATTYTWDFGDGTSSTAASPSHTYGSYGTYIVKLTASNGSCFSVYARTLRLFNPTPQFSGTPLNICKGGTVVFTPQSPAGIQTASWNYGDNTSSGTIAAVPVSKTYTTAGVYTVKLFITDSMACVDSMVKPAYVTVGGPTADFTASPTAGCVPATVAFTDATTTSGVSIAARTWTFGNGTTTTGNNTAPSTTYNSVGTYTVKLVVTDANGCKDSVTKASLISVVKPTAGFATTDTFKCPGQPVSFSNTSVSATGYLWDFGDGTTSTAVFPVKTYTAAGAYTVRLIATSVGGCKDTLTRTAYVKIAGGFAKFTMSDSVATCPPLSVQFTNTSLLGSSYVWTFGNGTSSVLTNPATLYSLPGIYTVKLKTTNTIGCVDSATKTVTVGGPTGTFSYGPAVTGCAPLTISVTVNAVNTVAYTYDYNNGITQTIAGNTITYTYPAGGVFVPKVVLSNGSGCNVALIGTDTIKVNKITPAFTANPLSLCEGAPVQFTDGSTAVTQPITARAWDFGDGTTSAATNPVKTYAAAGTYTVKLKVTSGACVDSITKTVTVLAKPVQLVAGGSAICSGTSANLVATGASTYVWTPTTGLACPTCATTAANPVATTTYTVIGTGSNGCSDTDQVTVTVNPLPVITTSAAPTICAGSATTLTASGASSYVWSPATGLSCTACASTSASPTVTTTYTVTGTDAAGCVGTKTVVVTVKPLPVLTVSAAPTICAGSSTVLNVSGGSGTTYSWSPATGLSCTTCSNPTAAPASTTTYTVTGTANGCAVTATVTVTVTPLPTVTASASPAGVCLGGSTTLTAAGAVTYTWAAAPGLTCTACASPGATPATTTTYTVTGVAASGCANTATVTVAVNPIPVVTASVAQASICAGTSTTLTGSGAATYIWSPAAGLSCNPCSNPTATPATTTTYTVTGTTTAGCSGTAQVTVTVKPAPAVAVSPSVAICAGASTALQASGALTYGWSPAAGLSCTTCDNPAASPATTTTYTVTGTGSNGCTASKTVTVTVNPRPTVSAGADRAICSNTPTALQATGAGTYLWSPATGLSCTTCAAPQATLTGPATYSVVGTDANGCVDSATVRLTLVPRMQAGVSPSDTLCLGSSKVLGATGGSSYTWSPAIGLSSPQVAAPTATPATTTTYQVIIRQGECYADTLKTTLVVTPVPTVNAGSDQTIFAGSTTHLFGQATVATKYTWTPAEGLSCADCLTPEATPRKTTTYTLEVRTGAGCAASDAVTVSVRCDNSQVFVPNTFTPNNDGHNDRFYPRGKGISQVLRFRVYDRWGEVVFDQQNFPPNDATYGWDGTFKGTILKPDVYVWMVETTCESGEPLTLKGDISIVR